MNIFLINASPLQLILAEELKYIKGWDSKECILAIRNVKGGNFIFSLKSEEDVKQYGSWKEIRFIEQYKHNNFKGYIKNFKLYQKTAINLIESNWPVKNIVFGNYVNEPMRHLANEYVKKGCNIYFLDEGTSTLFNYQTREENKTGTLFNFKLTKKIKYIFSRIYKKLFLNMNVSDIKMPVTFFTEYPLQTTKKTQILKNDYKYTKLKINKWQIDNKVYFLGTTFVKSKRISLQSYSKVLAFIRQYYNNIEIIYIPHPKENFEEAIQLCRVHKFTFNPIEIPFEIYLIKNNIRPAFISGFTTTAIFSCYSLFGENCKYHSFKIPELLIEPGNNYINDIYKYFKEKMHPQHFTLIEIDKL